MVIEKRASAVGMLVSTVSTTGCTHSKPSVHSVLSILKKTQTYKQSEKSAISTQFFSSVSVSTFHMQYKRIRKLCAKFSQTGSVPDIQHATRSWIPTIGRHCYIVLNHLSFRWKSVIPWALRERLINHIVKQYTGGTLRSWLVYNQSILMVKEYFIMLYRKINKISSRIITLYQGSQR